MRFTRYSKFNGLDVFGIDLGDLMEGLSDSLLYSGYDDDYYWTRERMPQDTSLDALRRALLQTLLDKELLSQHQVQQMLDENEGKYEGSQLQEMLNQLIERLVEEGYLKLQEEPQSERRRQMGAQGRRPRGRASPAQRQIRSDREGPGFSRLQDAAQLAGESGQELDGTSRHCASRHRRRSRSREQAI